MAESSLIVEPPKRLGSRTVEVDPKLLAAMAKDFGQNVWVGDGFVYDTAKEASNAVAQYRRALAQEKSVPDHTVKTRVWGQDKSGKLVTDRKQKAEWYVALSHDPARQKRTRTTNGASA